MCFAMKTVHLELVSDLTSEAFIATFKRFISRKSRPAHVYSDNGTTFVGAHKQIQELYNMYNDPQVQSEIKNCLRELEISWSFIPPNAPHFGGLWEAAVKSAKYHDSDRGQGSFDFWGNANDPLKLRLSSIRVPFYH